MPPPSTTDNSSCLVICWARSISSLPTVFAPAWARMRLVGGVPVDVPGHSGKTIPYELAKTCVQIGLDTQSTVPSVFSALIVYLLPSTVITLD